MPARLFDHERPEKVSMKRKNGVRGGSKVYSEGDRRVTLWWGLDFRQALLVCNQQTGGGQRTPCDILHASRCPFKAPLKGEADIESQDPSRLKPESHIPTP